MFIYGAIKDSLLTKEKVVGKARGIGGKPRSQAKIRAKVLSVALGKKKK